MDNEIVLAYYQKMSDEELINTLKTDIKGLTESAQEIVKGEIKRRHLDAEFINIVDIQQQVYEHIPKVFDPNECPVDDDKRIWIEQSMQFLLNLFGTENAQNRTILTPTGKHFPVLYDGSEKSAFDTLRIIANQMEVPAEKIKLDFYDEKLMHITEGNPGGLYWGKIEDGSFEISLVRKLLDEPEEMVATLAHEIAHIKLLGEGRMEENDEPLTDLTTIFFGLGIFSANAAFKTISDSKYYGWSTSGYLTQMEWGYALAFFSLIRSEEQPDWANHLCTNVKADFKQSLNFISNNPDTILSI